MPPKLFTITWTIENFSFCPQKNGECFESPRFVVRSLDKECSLVLYPRGDSGENAKFIACFLNNISIINLVSFDIEIIGASGRVLSRITRPDDSGNCLVGMEMYGSARFLPIREVVQDSQGSTGGTLTIHCRIYGGKIVENISEKYIVHTEIGADRQCFIFNKRTSLTVQRRHRIQLVAGESRRGVETKNRLINFGPNKYFDFTIDETHDNFKFVIVKLESERSHACFVECRVTLLKANDGTHGSPAIACCSQRETHFFHSDVSPDSWEFPSAIPADVVKECVREIEDNVTRINVVSFYCEFSYSSGVELAKIVSIEKGSPPLSNTE